MSKYRKPPAFIVNGVIRGRNYVRTTPGLDRKLRQEINNIRNGGSIRRATQRVIMDAVSASVASIVKAKVGNILNVDTSSIPPEMLGSDNSGQTHLISQFETKRTTSYGTEVVDVKRHSYKTYMNELPTGKFIENPYGFEKRKKRLMDTKSDYISPDERISLVTECGFNESIVDFFDHDSFLTMEDLHILTNCANEVAEYKEKKEKRKSRSISNIATGDKTRSEVKKQLAIAQLGEVSNDRLYSKILKYRTRLEIHADTVSYLTHVKVHLCTHRMFINCRGKDSALTTKELHDGVLKDIGDVEARSIDQQALLGKERKNARARKRKIKKTLRVTPGTRIFGSETLIDNVKRIRTFKFQLKPTEIGIVDLHHNFPRGIDLFDLNRCDIKESCGSTFFIVEAVGDPNARITHKEHGQSKHNGYSPVCLRYEILKEISFISNNKEPDKPDVLITEGSNNQFEEGALAEIFYPNRRPKLSVPINKLDIGGNNPKAKYKLDLDSRTLLTPTLLENAQVSEKNRFLDLDDADAINKFIKDTTKDLVESVNERHKDFYDTDNFFEQFEKNNTSTDEDIIDLDKNTTEEE